MLTKTIFSNKKRVLEYGQLADWNLLCEHEWIGTAKRIPARIGTAKRVPFLRLPEALIKIRHHKRTKSPRPLMPPGLHQFILKSRMQHHPPNQLFRSRIRLQIRRIQHRKLFKRIQASLFIVNHSI